MTEKLIETLLKELAAGGEVVTFTIVMTKNNKPYVITHDDFKSVCVEEVALYD